MNQQKIISSGEIMSKTKYIISREYLEEEYIKKNRSTISIAKDFGCSPDTINRKLKNYNIYKDLSCVNNRGKIDNEKLYQLYKEINLKVSEISSILGVKETSIYKRLNNLGWMKPKEERSFTKWRKYKINLDFFQDWTHELAWILGYTMADGNVSKNKRYVRWTIHPRDISALEFIRDACSPDSKIITKKINSGGKIIDRSYLYIWSGELCELLKKYNIFPAKTGYEKLPNIPIEFIPTYIRGIVDGDGCFSITKIKGKRSMRYHFGISGANSLFLSEIREHLFNYGRVEDNNPNNPNSCFKLKVSILPEIINIGDYIYSTPSFYLDRKHNKYLQIKEYRKQYRKWKK